MFTEQQQPLWTWLRNSGVLNSVIFHILPSGAPQAWQIHHYVLTPVHGQLRVCSCRTVGLEVVDVLGEVGNRFALNFSPKTQNHSAANGSCGTAFLHRLDYCNSLLTDLLLLSVSLISNSLSILLPEGSLHPLPLKPFTFLALSWEEIPFWEGHTRLFRIWPLQASSV